MEEEQKMSSTAGLGLYVAIYSITIFGSLLGMIAVFNSINSHFNSTWALPIALSLRTIFMYFSGKIGPGMFSKYSIKTSLRISELSGIIGVLVIIAAYKLNLLILAILGVAFLGLPGGLLGQGLVSIAKTNLEEASFRKLTGSLSKITGIIFIVTGVMTPYLLKKLDIYTLFSLDLVTYAVSLGLLVLVKRDGLKSDTKVEQARKALSFSKWEVSLTLFPALILIGLLPLVSGQVDFQTAISSSHTDLLRTGWAFEGLGMILAGLIYRFKDQRDFFFKLLSLSAVPLLVALTINHQLVIIVALMILGTSYSYCFLKVRDDYLVRYGNDNRDVFEISGYLMRLKSLFCIASPLILMQVFEKSDILTLFTGTLAFQTVVLIIITLRFSPLLKEETVC